MGECVWRCRCCLCITITSSLSGTYNSAVIAKDIYEHNHTGRKVYVLDSLSTGPEIALFIEKIAELIKAGFAPDDIYKTLLEYKDKTHLYFSLASLNNFAKNGRISPVIAAGIGLLESESLGRQVMKELYCRLTNAEVKKEH